MVSRILAFTFLVSVLLMQSAWAEALFLEGTVSHRGDELPIRLTLPESGADTLDIPTLWYAGEPVNIIEDGNNFQIELPFGIGSYTMVPEGDGYVSNGDDIVVRLSPADPRPYSTEDVALERAGTVTEGTLYLPTTEGPHPLVIIVGGANTRTRTSWGYRSKADFYARMGVAAYVYDRRAYDNAFGDSTLPTFWTHAADLDAIRDQLGQRDDIDADHIGVMAGSMGVWISTIAASEHGAFDFYIFTGVPAVSPSEQTIDQTIYGMRDDGLPQEEIDGAVNYLRLYFYVAATLSNYDALASAIAAGEGTRWIDYVDQPRNLDDLAWWHGHWAYDPRADLIGLGAPVLAMSGADDWITPPIENLPKIEFYAELGGNEHVWTMTVPYADHRLERPPGEDENGQWHWFEVAQEAREAIPTFLRGEVGLSLTN